MKSAEDLKKKKMQQNVIGECPDQGLDIKVKFLNPFSRKQENGFLIKDPLFCGGYKIESENLVFSRILIKYFKVYERR